MDPKIKIKQTATPAVLDVRALAAFRIFLGIYMLYDIYDRTSLGKYDLAWYTSLPEDRSYLAADDTPHKAPLHRLWFYRGSFELNIMSFAVSVLLALLFLLGFQCHAGVKTALWFVQVAQHSRAMEVSDGSDAFLRQLLLWCIFLPVAKVWSVDAYLQQRPTDRPPCTPVVSGLPCLALTLQIALMYWGTILNRTLDPLFDGTLGTFKEMRWSEVWSAILDNDNQWTGDFSAVHYALSGPFGAREHAFNNLIRQNAWISQTLTAQAMIIEGTGPLMCLVCGDQRHWPAFLLFLFHAGLLATFNIPNWQALGLIIQVLWIPSHVWDDWRFKVGMEMTRVGYENESHKKTDGDATDENMLSVSRAWLQSDQRQSLTARLSRILQLFFFVHMIYNWTLYRGVIPKLDNGDIGQGLRLSQHWLMFGTVAQRGSTIQLTGKVRLPSAAGESEDSANVTRLDLFHFIKTGQDRVQDPPSFIPHDMTYRYPSPRWEKAMHDWAMAGDLWSRGERVCRVLCIFVNEDRLRRGKQKVSEVEMRYQMVNVLPPGSKVRYAKRRPLFDDEVVVATCH